MGTSNPRGYRHFVRSLVKKFFVLTALTASVLHSVSLRADSRSQTQSFSYYGRLPANYQNETTVTFEVSFYESAQGNDVVSRVPRIYKNHPVSSGGFSLLIEMDQHEFDSVFQIPRRPAFIQIRDLTKNVTFKRQAFLPASEAAPRQSEPQYFVDKASFLTVARAACIATNTAGAKFLTEISNPGINCQSACVHSEARSSCVRGWTLFTDGNYFEFGNECSSVVSGFATPVQARLCCCLTTFRPMPVQLESQHH